MTEHSLPGTGTAIPPITTSLITLSVANNTELTEVSVAVRKAGKPITGRYDLQAKTANVKLLAADFQALSSALSNNGAVSINYVYNDVDYTVVRFTWLAIAAVVALESTIPQSTIKLAATATAAVASKTG